jgi:uncharacterized membrane protein YphA (DoxX/SURF4 family)
MPAIPLYFSPMHWKTVAAFLAASVLLATGNNLVNPDRVAWLGSPEILPKPTGWPELSAWQGMAAGAKHAGKETARHWGWVAGALVLLAAGALASRRRHKPARPWVFSWFRVMFALMYLAAAYPKFTDPEGFALLVAQYQFLPAFAVNAFSLWLPAIEIVVGLALLFSPFEREASAGVLLLMVMFIVALGQALARGLGIACGCFDIEGATDPGESWFALLRDVVLLWPAAWMSIKGGRRYPWHF